MQQRISFGQYRRRSKKAQHQREILFDVACGVVCGVVAVVFGWLLLQWFHDGGAELLGFGLAVMP